MQKSKKKKSKKERISIELDYKSMKRLSEALIKKNKKLFKELSKY